MNESKYETLHRSINVWRRHDRTNATFIAATCGCENVGTGNVLPKLRKIFIFVVTLRLFRILISDRVIENGEEKSTTMAVIFNLTNTMEST